MSRKPIVTFPILVARADCAPDNCGRIRSEGCIVDIEGKPLEYPEKTPEKNALEGDPNLMYEHWDEFWRKVHGECAFYKDSEEDRMEEAAATYYQVHRFAGGPSCYFAPPYPAPVDENGSMYPYLYDKVSKYIRPQHDGLVYWGARTIDDLRYIAESDKAVNKFNEQGHIFNRSNVGSMCAEYVIIPLKGALPAICVVKEHYRKGGTQEEIQDYILKEHADFVAGGPAAKKYIRRLAYMMNVNKKPGEPYYDSLGVQVDAISVTYFDNLADCEAYYGSDEYRAVAEKEKTFLSEKSEWWTGLVYPFKYPTDEEVTDREDKWWIPELEKFKYDESALNVKL